MLPGVGRLLVDGEPVGDESEVFRTGFVIDSSHVLTAAHCVRGVDEADASLWLRLLHEREPGDDGPDTGGGGYLLVPLRVAELDESGLDAAVLVVDPRREPRPAVGAERLAACLERVAVPLGIEVSAREGVRAEGFPASTGNPHGRAFSGEISDVRARLAGAWSLELFFDQAAAVSAEGPGGLSGGPVLRKAGPDAAAEEVAVGVVHGFPRGEERWQAQGGTVYASRVADLAGRFTAVADAVARRAQRALAAGGDPPRSGPARSLVELLRADAAITGFRGREKERDQLHAWCGSPAQRSAWLIVGPAGQGKTRLARWLLADRAGAGGWLAALFRGPGDLDRLGTALTVAAHLEHSVLVVVDYAAEHGAASLHPLVEKLAATRAWWRLLLLARATGDWWTQPSTGVRSMLEEAGTEVRDPELALTALEPTVEGRERAFRAVVAALREPVRLFAENHDLPFVADPPVPSLNREEFGSALMLHIAAACALLPISRPGEDRRGSSPAVIRGADLLGRILDIERDHHWLYQKIGTQTLYRPTEEAFGSLAHGLAGPGNVETAVAAATLAGAANLKEAVPLVRAALGLPEDGPRARQIARWLHDLYPSAEDSDGWLPPLQPDLLGEELVARVIRRAVDDDCDPLTTTLPYRLLQQPVGSPPTDDQVRRMLTVVSRAAQRHALLARLLDGGPSSGGLSESPVLARVPSQVDLTPVEAALPHATTSLLAFAVQLTTHVLDRHIATVRPEHPAEPITYEDAAELARLQNNLAIRLSEVGRRAEALAPATEATNIRRRLAENAPDAYLPNLATSLAVMASVLRGVRGEDAVAAAVEAVEILGILTDRLPEAFGSRFVSGCHLLADLLDGLGRPEEAAEIRGRLAADM
ncbi:S1 family peptidase [Frankia sp. CiP1_Cm_nod1]|uniref:S1 family peptidase n=1 Tax=Frankia sp. CiP1_Cm_nod1 TaxID=2897160 RepID=UPI002024CD80